MAGCEKGVHAANAGEPCCPCGAMLFRWRVGGCDSFPNPLAGTADPVASPTPEWKCFHCGMIIRDKQHAREHFGPIAGSGTFCAERAALVSERDDAIDQLARVALVVQRAGWSGTVDTPVVDRVAEMLRASPVSEAHSTPPTASEAFYQQPVEDLVQRTVEAVNKIMPEDVLDYFKKASEEHPHDDSYSGGRAAFAGIAFDQLELALRNQRLATADDSRFAELYSIIARLSAPDDVTDASLLQRLGAQAKALVMALRGVAPVSEAGEARKPQLVINGTKDEIDYVAHAASLRGQSAEEYAKRAINAALMKQGVDAVLFAESDDEPAEAGEATPPPQGKP